jgi:hypothetical protein
MDFSFLLSDVPRLNSIADKEKEEKITAIGHLTPPGNQLTASI